MFSCIFSKFHFSSNCCPRIKTSDPMQVSFTRQINAYICTLAYIRWALFSYGLSLEEEVVFIKIPTLCWVSAYFFYRSWIGEVLRTWVWRNLYRAMANSFIMYVFKYCLSLNITGARLTSPTWIQILAITLTSCVLFLKGILTLNLNFRIFVTNNKSKYQLSS